MSKRSAGWLVLLAFTVWFAGCNVSGGDALPTLVPTAGLTVTEQAVEEDASAWVELENGVFITADPARFSTFKSDVLNLRFKHPPELEFWTPQTEEDGALGFLVNGNLSVDSAAETYEGTGLSVTVLDANLYANIPGVDVGDPVTVLQNGHIDPYLVNGGEAIQPAAAMTLNGRQAASALVHQHPFPGGDLLRSTYIVVVLDDYRVITFSGDASLADEEVMLPVWEAVVHSLEFVD